MSKFSWRTPAGPSLVTISNDKSVVCVVAARKMTGKEVQEILGLKDEDFPEGESCPDLELIPVTDWNDEGMFKASFSVSVEAGERIKPDIKKLTGRGGPFLLATITPRPSGPSRGPDLRLVSQVASDLPQP
jgi:hypothetical protein